MAEGALLRRERIVFSVVAWAGRVGILNCVFVGIFGFAQAACRAFVEWGLVPERVHAGSLRDFCSLQDRLT